MCTVYVLYMFTVCNWYINNIVLNYELTIHKSTAEISVVLRKT